MRTTLTLDDDVAAALKRAARSSGRTFKEIVNDGLRVGLGLRSGGRARKYTVVTFSSEFAPGVDPGRLNPLYDELEAEEHRVPRP